MASVGMNIDISPLVDAVVAGDIARITSAGRDLIARGAGASELIGRIGTIAAHGDSDGHTVISMGAASMLCRWFVSLQYALGEDPANHERELPLLVQSVAAAMPAVQAGIQVKPRDEANYPKPLYPSDLQEGDTVNAEMHKAIYNGDATTVERLLFGLYGTGADYRTINIRLYDGMSTTFENGGHPLMCAVRGLQLLDAVEWGKSTPDIIHWLAPHVPIHGNEPAWVQTVRDFLADPSHKLDSYRTRLAAPKNENALPLRNLLQSDATPEQVCAGVYDALMNKGASSEGIGSVIALTATDLMQRVGDEDREAFINAAHGLLFAAAVRIAFKQVQDVEALPMLFTSAAYVHALHQQLARPQVNVPATPRPYFSAGLIAPALLDSLSEQLEAQDLQAAFSTARRYTQLEHDVRAMFAIIALAAAKADAVADQGHTLQIVQAAGEEFMAWPKDLASTNIDGFLHVALRAASFAKRNALATS
ncbi:MAG TPA: hypothetical protein VFA41_20050 [Ktedonobacteraceae bacterium]|jgi:hypothetical protein|nr:hypothetical protein [Ktedonobacteraceae bacterium]